MIKKRNNLWMQKITAASLKNGLSLNFTLFQRLPCGAQRNGGTASGFQREAVFTGLWITQWSILTAGWCSPSATEWKSAQRFKARSSRGIGFVPDASDSFFLCAEIG